jgi:shikimate dehydrogenase
MGKETVLRAGLIGAGIQASRSPSMHMTEARALGLNLVYELFDLDVIAGGVDALPDILARVRAENYLGVNITYPVKQTVLSLLDSYSDDARALGACNTLVFQGGRAIGHNTDWMGFAENFRRGLPDAALDSVVQLGAGGAGSAVTYALLKLGARRIMIHEIEKERAGAFVERFNRLAGGERVCLARDLERDVAAANGIVNCTPIGMAKHPGTPLPAHLLRHDLWVSDIVYVPLRTELLRLAAAQGCRTLEGGGMAVFQAAEALRLFTGKTPDAERMLAQFHRACEAERIAGGA